MTNKLYSYVKFYIDPFFILNPNNVILSFYNTGEKKLYDYFKIIFISVTDELQNTGTIMNIEVYKHQHKLRYISRIHLYTPAPTINAVLSAVQVLTTGLMSYLLLFS